VAGAAKTPSKSKAKNGRSTGTSSTKAQAKKAPARRAKTATKATGAKQAAAPKARTKKPSGAQPAAKKATRGKTPKAANDTGPAESSGQGGSLKQRFAALQTATREITGMKRSIATSFFDVGVILNKIRDKRLYEVKGYGSFESFVEREISLNKVVCLRSARIAQAIDRDIAVEAGLDRAAAAVAALDGEAPPTKVAAGGRAAAPTLIPLHKQ